MLVKKLALLTPFMLSAVQMNAVVTSRDLCIPPDFVADEAPRVLDDLICCGPLQEGSFYWPDNRREYFHDTALTREDEQRIYSLLHSVKRNNPAKYGRLKESLAIRQARIQKELPELAAGTQFIFALRALTTAGLGVVSGFSLFDAYHLAKHPKVPQEVVTTVGGTGLAFGGLALYMARKAKQDFVNWWNGDFNENVKQAKTIARIFKEVEDEAERAKQWNEDDPVTFIVHAKKN